MYILRIAQQELNPDRGALLKHEKNIKNLSDDKKTTVLCFLPSWSTLLFERGLEEEGRFYVTSRSETPKTSCQNHRQQLLRPRSGPSKGLFLLYPFRFRKTSRSENTRSFWVNRNRNSIPVLVYKPGHELVYLGLCWFTVGGNPTTRRNTNTNKWVGIFFFFCWSIDVFVSFLVFVSSLEKIFCALAFVEVPPQLRRKAQQTIPRLVPHLSHRFSLRKGRLSTQQQLSISCW